MRVLLDTQCWLWMNLAPDRLSPAARATVASPDTELWLSVASVWEIVIKHAIGKLRLPLPPREYVPTRVARDGVRPLPVELEHALRVADLPAHHRDPFDRLLIAQAIHEQLPIMTNDPQFVPYGIQLLDA